MSNKVRTLFCQFNMGDVEDPEIYLAAPVYQWQQTEAGEWAMANGEDLHYDVSVDHNTYGYRVSIHGLLTEENYTYFALKYKK